jgi:CheY-like chemotaxis protein
MARQLLLADDSVTIQRVIELTFADEDIQVVAVGDGDAAIARLSAHAPDIVLADVDMPGQDGYAIASHVRDTPSLHHIPVLLLTGAFDPVDEARAHAAGVAGVLVKPFEPQMLIARVWELLDRPAGPSDASAPESRLATDPEHLAAATSPAANQSVDEYFDRLDAAFATLNASAVLPAQPPSGMPSPVAASSLTAFESPHSPAPAGDQTDAPVMSQPLSLADAFGALLGIEEGHPPPVLPDTWSATVSDDVIEQVVRRLTDEVSERIVRQLAPDIVSRVAERLVREEIERLKASVHE